ncbi:thiamine biosynthesis protein ApbE [Pseudoxanthomonas yeongjuensis]|nr:thiamine biosynthesis protein ApbE [Pseudoxanthomonas yeongjuensis]
MGTSWCVKLVASPRADSHVLHAGIQQRLDRVVAQMSNWEADSDLGRFNRSAAGSWHRLPEEFFEVLSYALEIARDSEGAYDPTIGALVEAWGFGPAQHAHAIPADIALSTARADAGWQRLILDAEKSSALQPGRLQLDLSAIAKGYGVDLVARHLRDIGIAAALVEVGGELYGYGRKPDDSAWQVLVEASPDEDAVDATDPRVIALDGIAIATSGDHWHAFEQQGMRYSHTLDPRTGKPVEHAPAAVTVIADDAMRADAWATALTVMGATAGFELAQSRNLAARFASRTEHGLREHMTDAFLARLPA